MLFTPEMSRNDAILVATSDSSGTQSRILSYEEERAIVVADRENRFWKGIMTNRVGVCG
jgi:hypothetical protein